MGNPNRRNQSDKPVLRSLPQKAKDQVMRVHAVFRGRSVFVRDMNAQKLAQFSEFAKKKMQEMTDQPARLDVIGVTPGALFKVLNVVDWHTGELEINVHNNVLPQAIAVYQATRALAIQPEQKHIKRYLWWHISSLKILPEDIAAIDQLDLDDVRSLATSRIAGTFCNGGFTVGEVAALRFECSKHPALDGDIDTKVKRINQQALERLKRQQPAKTMRADRPRRLDKVHGPRDTARATSNLVMQRSVGAELVDRAMPMRQRRKNKGKGSSGKAGRVGADNAMERAV